MAIRAESPGFAGELIGSVGVRRISAEASMYVIGYSLHPDWQRQRIMSAAVTAALWYGAVYQKVIKSAIIQVAEDNAGSRKVVEGLEGFVPFPEMDVVEEWPEGKGGGRKALRTWKWIA